MVRCLSSRDEVLIHGTNGVCGPPRASAFGLAGFAVATALALGLLARRTGTRWVAALVVACALPGWWMLAAVRADRPGHAREVTDPPRALASALHSFAAAHHDCVRVRNDGCLGCEPIVRFAIPPQRGCAAPAAITLAPDALERGCRAGAALVCGGGS